MDQAVIYVPSDLYLAEIDRLPDLPQEMMLYFIHEDNNEMQIYRDVLPPEYEDVVFHKVGMSRKTLIRRWQPSGYSVIVKDLDKIYSVIAEIQDAGFQADCDYVDTGALIGVQERTRTMMIVISGSIYLILLSASLIMQYTRRGQLRNLDMYLYISGYNAKQRSRYFRDMFLKNTVLYSIAAMFLYFTAVNVLLQTAVTFIRPEPRTFAGIAAVVLITEYLMPGLLLKETSVQPHYHA